MKRLAWPAGFLAVLAVPLTAHARSDFDPSAQAIVLTKDGTLAAYDFESADTLTGLELTTWTSVDGYPTLERTKITGPADVSSRLTEAEDAIEGAHALRLGSEGKGLAIVDESLFAKVKDGKFEVALWARADGAAPQLHVVYDRDPNNIYGGEAQFATVRGIRTGRQTTDGWAEYSTGPLDGSVWGVPVRAVAIVPSFYLDDVKASFLVDALEVRQVAGAPVAPLACTQQTVDNVCGPEGDCMFGHCVSSTVTWGVLPPLAHRNEIAERWVQIGTRFIGDRNAAKNGQTILTPGARDLAKSSTSSRHFYGGLNRLVNLLRDNHTSFGSPSNLTSFAPQIQQGTSSTLGACFGVVEKDVMGGGLSFGVFRASDTPLTGIPLKRGDIVFAIDGRDPKEWVDEVWPRHATTLPNDPRSDWGPAANQLSRLITTRASTVTLQRCTSATACTGDDKQTITIDIASVIYKALTDPSAEPPPRSFSCTQRFSNSVNPTGGGGGEDPVYTAVGSSGETRVQFDGFVGEERWKASMASIFDGTKSRVLMDARMGHGGYYDTVEYLFNLVRGTSEPVGVLSLGRSNYDMADPPWLFSRLGGCAAARGGDQWECFAANANGFFATSARPSGAGTKIAWVNTLDVSANDFMPRLLAGRTKVRIFGPHPTAGAFGAVTSLPSFMPTYSGGSLQIQDARFAPAVGSVGEARWESGHGVEPDVVVAQKLSDTLNGVDTLLQVATAWLVQP